MGELVSIIMPNYNCEKFLPETIESVIGQTYTEWELLIVDDCSTDNSVNIIKGYCDKDDRIKLIVNEKNSGAAHSRNVALAEAKGKWIAFLDSDDIWLPGKLEKQIKFMEEGGYHFSYTKYARIDESSHLMGIEISGPKKITRRKMFRYCYLGCLTVMYDSEVIGLLQLRDDIWKNNDYALWLKASKKAVAYYLDETLAYYRIRKGSISRHSKISLIKHHYRLFKLSENMGSLRAFYYTCKNMFFGVFKKLKYEKKAGTSK